MVSNTRKLIFVTKGGSNTLRFSVFPDRFMVAITFDNYCMRVNFGVFRNEEFEPIIVYYGKEMYHDMDIFLSDKEKLSNLETVMRDEIAEDISEFLQGQYSDLHELEHFHDFDYLDCDRMEARWSEKLKENFEKLR